MIETPFYFPNGGYTLFGVLHEPERATAKPAFVFCHPFGEEKLWTHRVFVSFARRIAAEGHPVLRFDYMGNGDSDGEFSRSTLETALSDVRCAIDEVKRRTAASTVSLLGLRMGATIASLVADDVSGIDQLVLWPPVVDGGRYMQEQLRINLATQMATYKEIRQDRQALVEAMQQGLTVNIDGYEMDVGLYQQISAVNLANETRRYLGPCLIAQVDRQPGRPDGDLQRLAAAYPRATLSSVQEEPFWKEIPRWYRHAPNLFEVTCSWLAAQ